MGRKQLDSSCCQMGMANSAMFTVVWLQTRPERNTLRSGGCAGGYWSGPLCVLIYPFLSREVIIQSDEFVVLGSVWGSSTIDGSRGPLDGQSSGELFLNG